MKGSTSVFYSFILFSLIPVSSKFLMQKLTTVSSFIPSALTSVLIKIIIEDLIITFALSSRFAHPLPHKNSCARVNQYICEFIPLTCHLRNHFVCISSSDTHFFMRRGMRTHFPQKIDSPSDLSFSRNNC